MPPRKNFDAPEIVPICACIWPQVKLSATARVSCGFRVRRDFNEFIAELKRFNDDVQAKAGSLQARFAALGSSWQDQEAEKFAEEFITTMKVLKKFVEIAEKHTPYLLRKAQRIEEYLDQR